MGLLPAGDCLRVPSPSKAKSRRFVFSRSGRFSVEVGQAHPVWLVLALLFVAQRIVLDDFLVVVPEMRVRHSQRLEYTLRRKLARRHPAHSFDDQSERREAAYGPVHTVVRQGSAGNRYPHADLADYPEAGALWSTSAVTEDSLRRTAEFRSTANTGQPHASAPPLSIY